MRLLSPIGNRHLDMPIIRIRNYWVCYFYSEYWKRCYYLICTEMEWTMCGARVEIPLNKAPYLLRYTGGNKRRHKRIIGKHIEYLRKTLPI